MKGLPINIVNLICEWAAQEDVDWYPFFCPKTHKLSWKVNKYSRKHLERGDIIFHNILDSYLVKGELRFSHIYNGLIIDNIHFEAIVWQYIDGTFKMYIEFDSEINQDLKEKYIFRTMINFGRATEDEFYNTSKKDDIYLNGSIYGTIESASFVNYTTPTNLLILIDTY